MTFGEASDLNVNTEHCFPGEKNCPSLDVHTVRCTTVRPFSAGALFFAVFFFCSLKVTREKKAENHCEWQSWGLGANKH